MRHTRLANGKDVTIPIQDTMSGYPWITIALLFNRVLLAAPLNIGLLLETADEGHDQADCIPQALLARKSSHSRTCERCEAKDLVWHWDESCNQLLAFPRKLFRANADSQLRHKCSEAM